MASAATPPPPETGPVKLLVGTRKGAFCLVSDSERRTWTLSEPLFLGHIVNHWVSDPRDPDTHLMAARTGHLGPTLFRSHDAGATWAEAPSPPAFPKAADGEGRVVGHTFWLEPGHESEPGVWWAGTSPQALFRSEDAGATWESISGFNDHPDWPKWTGDGQDQTPDGAILHSIRIDPRDPAHLYVSLSGGGTFETLDRGASWKPLNGGVMAVEPDPYPEYGQDPHCLQMHPLDPDLLYQQNHCGIYRLERPGERWVRIGENMPEDVGDIGFPIGLHPRDTQTAWVFPMDGTDVWPRTSPGGRPAVYRTRDGGASWERLDRGLPPGQAWLTVLRQCMAVDRHDPVGVYFGTTTGEIWASRDEGESWTCIAPYLPQILTVEQAARA